MAALIACGLIFAESDPDEDRRIAGRRRCKHGRDLFAIEQNPGRGYSITGWRRRQHRFDPTQSSLSAHQLEEVIFRQTFLFTSDQFRTHIMTGELEEAVRAPRKVYDDRRQGPARERRRRRCKASPAQRVLFVLHRLRFNPTLLEMQHVAHWSSTSLDDDFFHVLACLRESLRGEVVWPDAAERQRLRHEQLGTFGIVDGTLSRTLEDANQRRENFRSDKGYGIAAQGVISNEGNCIHIEAGFQGSESDKGMWNLSELHLRHHEFFSPGEALLADGGYHPNYDDQHHDVLKRPFSNSDLQRLLEVNPNPEAIDIQSLLEFNTLHRSARSLVERWFAKLKNSYAIVSSHSAFRCNVQLHEPIFEVCVFLTQLSVRLDGFVIDGEEFSI